MKRKINTCLLLLFTLLLSAQVPDTDLWLFELKPDKKNKRLFPNQGINITNRSGYDNQPSFSQDGKRIYYVSIREDKQADIYYYDLAKKKTNRLTSSKESEYSPVLMPNGKLLSVVMVEADSAQRIHYINAEKGDNESRLEPDSVGYYAFLNTDTVIYYKLTQPHSLLLHSIKTGADKWLGNQPCRTFRKINRNTLIYGLKDSLKVTFFKYHFLLHKAERYCEYPSLNEDVIWHPEMGLIKSEEARLYRYNETGKNWELLYDMGLFGIKKITRFAFDSKNKYLVVVNNL